MFDADFSSCNLIKEYDGLSERDEWNSLFQRIKNKSSSKIGILDCSVSRNVNNRFKNIFREVVPYDFNRVILSMKTEDGSDYINASHIHVRSRYYIMTQYPNSATVELFWSMVWQFKSHGVIMLGKLYNDESSNYFPKLNKEVCIIKRNNSEEKIFHILTKEEITYDGFTQRRLQLFNVEMEESIDLWHFEFWSWPDQGVPRCMESFLSLLGALRQHNIVDSVTNPPIVHCSAGAGRSGTFCLIDIAIMMMENDGDVNNINIPELMDDLRGQRMGIIRTFDQLKFCYEVVIDVFKKYKRSDKFTDLYLLVKEKPHYCANNHTTTTSSSSSEEADLDTVLYYPLYYESEENSDNELPLLTSQELCNEKEKLTNVEEIEYQRIDRQCIISQRKLRNNERISILTRHLEDNRLRRHRLVSTISSISSVLLDELNSDQFKAIIVIGGLVLFMGTIFGHRYFTSKYSD